MQNTTPQRFTSEFTKTQVYLEKLFHHNNIVLQIDNDDVDSQDPWFHINIHRINNRENISLFGIFHTYNDALKKFNQIQL